MATDSKIEFRPYHSIENHYNKDATAKLTKLSLTNPKLEWVATEKVHGANFQFITDGKDVQCAKRTALLTKKDNDHFFKFLVILNKYKMKILQAFGKLKEMDSKVTNILFYGELFGGTYPHKDVEAIPNVVQVQKHIYYCPHTDFYAFDIWTDTQGFLDYDKCEVIWKQFDFLYAKSLAKGSLNELYSFDVETLQTWLPTHYKLPIIEKNYAEGIVIRPRIVPKEFVLSEIVVKKKAKAFFELRKVASIGNIEKKDKKGKHVQLAMNADNQLVEDIKRYITKNRFDSVVSKLGTNHKSIAGAYMKDVLTDWKKDNLEKYNNFTKDEKTAFHTNLNALCSLFVEEQMDKNNPMNKN